MKNFKVLFVLFLVVIILFSLFNTCYAADPKLVNTIKKAFEAIESWILKLATPAAAVAVRYWSFYEKV